MADEKKEKLAKYGKSEQGNFEVIDTIGVPHPYCITPRHMLPDHMFMNADTIREAEKTNDAACDICRQNHRRDYSKSILTYDQHETALLVACYKDPKSNETLGKELQNFMLKCKPFCEADKYAGFAFAKKF